jgi:hypothetical protein
MWARANGCPHGAVEVDEHLFVLRPQTMLQTVLVGARPGGSFAVGSGSLWSQSPDEASVAAHRGAGDI